MLDLRMRSVGLLLIIVSKERSLSLLHGVIFSLSESAAYISVIPGHYLWGKGYSKCLYSQNLYLKQVAVYKTGWRVWLLFGSYQKT